MNRYVSDRDFIGIDVYYFRLKKPWLLNEFGTNTRITALIVNVNGLWLNDLKFDDGFSLHIIQNLGSTLDSKQFLHCWQNTQSDALC